MTVIAKAAVYQMNEHRKGIFWSAVCCLVVLCGMYMYLINATVLNVVAREKYENQIADLSSKVGDLEFKNIALKNSITIDKATLLGFVETTDVTFISRDSRNLSYNSR